MSVRIIPKNYRNITGIFQSSKPNRANGYESSLERDFLTLLEIRANVDHYISQPVKIFWEDEKGKKRSYTPDVLVNFKEGSNDISVPELYEVKYMSDLKENIASIRPKVIAGREYAKSQGWNFRVITDRDIRTTKLKNAQFLVPFLRRNYPDVALQDQIDNALRDLSNTTTGALITHIYKDKLNQAKLLPCLWYMIGTNQIGIDLDQPLSMVSKIWSIE